LRIHRIALASDFRETGSGDDPIGRNGAEPIALKHDAK